MYKELYIFHSAEESSPGNVLLYIDADRQTEASILLRKQENGERVKKKKKIKCRALLYFTFTCHFVIAMHHHDFG